MLLDIKDIGVDEIEADLCIVGGGAAGLTLAAALAESGVRIVVLEAGGLRESAAASDAYRGEVCGNAAHPEPHLYRLRALGGSSRAWGGGCVPLDPIDFEERPWVPGPGWPYGLDTLLPYYRQAQEACEAGAFDYEAPTPLIRDLEGRRFRTVLERFSRPTDFGRRWAPLLKRSGNLQVVLNASATNIRLDESGAQVAAIEVAAPDGRRLRVRARRFVLAMGGLETTRLLLASDQERAGGLGNHSGWLGRGYMCHLAAIVGSVTFNGGAQAVAFGHSRDPTGVYFRRRLLLRPEVQRERKLLNLAFRLQPQDPGDPSHGDPILSALHLYKSVVEPRYDRNYREVTRTERRTSRHLQNLARRPGRLARAAATIVRERFLESRRAPSVAFPAANNCYALEFHGEQAPNPDSRVGLSTAKDAFGMPRLRVHWRPHPLDTETVLQAYRMLSEELQRTGAGRLNATDDQLLDQISTAGAYGGHHIGSTRMSLDPKQGVVDPDCRVHGIGNLFVASSSVMPTSGQANPTLTIVALAYKLAAYLTTLPMGV
ncbi:MAG: FAD-dependent oxidoreductase [Phenylobacterium sp.]|uniref:FAD-dependent oxidoreductase n=1 Tax=Phenylobacterium sp. TaxID=1871053 RepID=UPI00391C631E